MSMNVWIKNGIYGQLGAHLTVANHSRTKDRKNCKIQLNLQIQLSYDKSKQKSRRNEHFQLRN